MPLKIVIDEIELPNDFLALPDEVTHGRIGDDVAQETTTEFRIKYSIYPEEFAFDSTRVRIELGDKLSKEYDLSHTSGRDNEEVVTVVLDDDWEVSADDVGDEVLDTRPAARDQKVKFSPTTGPSNFICMVLPLMLRSASK